MCYIGKKCDQSVTWTKNVPKNNNSEAQLKFTVLIKKCILDFITGVICFGIVFHTITNMI